MDYKIISNCGHCEIYIDGKFYCSTDDWEEAEKEIEEYEAQNCYIEV